MFVHTALAVPEQMELRSIWNSSAEDITLVVTQVTLSSESFAGNCFSTGYHFSCCCGQQIARDTMQSSTSPNFGRYQILGEIGRGAMGVVYKARDPKIDRIVAIKTIALSEHLSLEEKEFRDRFFLEAKAAGRLSHPSIVTIYDVGEDEESRNPFIVMEYVEGVSLDQQLLESGGDYDADSALALVQEVASALDYAHSQGIVHRDIKPANILLTREGRPKVTDFGVAKLNMAYTTVAGHSLGTPAYMSPEQLNGDPVDGRSDLFSLGVILYTLLTGHRPFQGNSAMTVSFRVVHRDPLPVSAYDSNFPPDVDFVIGRAIAKDSALRYQTGKELAQDLDDLREGRTPRSKEKQSAAGAPATAASPLITSTTSRTFKASELASRRRSADRAPRWSMWEFAALILLAMGVTALSLAVFRPARSADLNPMPSPTSARVTRSGTSPANPAEGVYSASSPLSRANRAISNAPAPLAKPASSLPPATPHAVAQPSEPGSAAVVNTSGTSLSEPPQKSATLHIRFEHGFASAQVLVWVDDKLAYKEFSNGMVKRRMGLFKAVKGYKSDSFSLSAGEHRLRVRVQSGDSEYDRAATIVGMLPANAERVLSVNCTNRKQIHLTLE
jgi:serine/threonine protein kinase